MVLWALSFPINCFRKHFCSWFLRKTHEDSAFGSRLEIFRNKQEHARMASIMFYKATGMVFFSLNFSNPYLNNFLSMLLAEK